MDGVSVATRLRQAVGLPLALVLVWCSKGADQRPGDAADHETDGPATTAALPCIAPVVARSCGVADCHDAVTKEHGMDLSTGEGIYEAWLGQNGTGRKGLNHCSNTAISRVVPGNPEASYVMMKITATLECQNDLSRPMPPPPLPALPPEEIDAIRTWILRGATKDCSESTIITDGGADGSIDPTDAGSADASSDDGGPIEDAAADSGPTDARPEDGSTSDGAPDDGGDGGTVDPSVCTDTQPCQGALVCAGTECGVPWDCVSHFEDPDGPLEHPCPPEIVSYCGCDGVTFEAQDTCPQRPFEYRGACGSSHNCNALASTCGMTQPTCPAGETASVVDKCFGACVPSTMCRCNHSMECPEGYWCDVNVRFCVVIPPDGGT
jgi:hypothetical protein